MSAGYCLSLRRLFCIPVVTRESHPISSHARNRESIAAFPQEKRQRVFRASAVDSRFRSCEEIGRISLRRSEHRRIGAEEDNVHPVNTSSSPRKRESRGGARKTRRWVYCETAGLDSRFRGNDEWLLAIFCLSPHRIVDAPDVTCEAPRFLHTLESGNLVWRFRNITVGESCVRRP